MTWTPISGAPLQYHTDNNGLASDYWLKFYTANTTTPFSVAIDANGTSPLAKVKLNTAGYPISDDGNNDSIFIPFVDRDYRMVMYKSEADADANNTSNAAFNVNPIPQNISPILENAVAVTLRESTVLIQDDYDRSPLFVDGTDFTAGAGPHVITVPAGWTPSNSDTRFYKLDSSGIVTPITPTAKDATSFTTPITLLSTDTLFIGDDKFRNQMNGDPEDIKARLTLTDALLASNNLSEVDPAISRTNIDVYSKSESDTAFIEDGTGTVSNTNLATDSVTNSKLAADSVDGGKIQSPSSGDSYNVFQYVGSVEVTTNQISYRNPTEYYSFNAPESLTATCLVDGIVRITLSHRTDVGTSTVRILLNGVQLEEWSTSSVTPVTRMTDVTIGLGSRLQIQQKASSGSISYLSNAIVQSANNTFCVA